MLPIMMRCFLKSVLCIELCCEFMSSYYFHCICMKLINIMFTLRVRVIYLRIFTFKILEVFLFYNSIYSLFQSMCRQVLHG